MQRQRLSVAVTQKHNLELLLNTQCRPQQSIQSQKQGNTVQAFFPLCVNSATPLRWLWHSFVLLYAHVRTHTHTHTHKQAYLSYSGKLTPYSQSRLRLCTFQSVCNPGPSLPLCLCLSFSLSHTSPAPSLRVDKAATEEVAHPRG